MRARSLTAPTESDVMAPTGPWAKVGTVIVREFKEVMPPTVFVGFNLILFTKRLMLSEYLIAYAGFLVATTGALIVGKVVLIADKMPVLRRFDYAPVAYPILFKAAVYTALVQRFRETSPIRWREPRITKRFADIRHTSRSKEVLY
jgi:hypothetical protein